jgi:hypothetical protein
MVGMSKKYSFFKVGLFQLIKLRKRTAATTMIESTEERQCVGGCLKRMRKQRKEI